MRAEEIPPVGSAVAANPTPAALDDPSGADARAGAQSKPGRGGRMRRAAAWLGRPAGKSGIPLLSAIGWLVGLGVIAFLLMRTEPGALWAAVVRAKAWLALIVAWHFLPLLCDSIAWQRMFTRRPAALRRILFGRWIGEGANALIPVPHIGEVLRARVARGKDHDGVATTATVVADITLGVASQIPFTALGLVLFGVDRSSGLTLRPLALLAPLVLFSLGFYLAQRSGALTAFAGRIGRAMGAAAGLFDAAKLRRLDEDLAAIYRRRRAVLGGLLWHCLSWLLGAGEVWIALRAFGHPLGIADALSIESLGMAARVAAFFIPAGLGAQEGALVALAVQCGVPAEIALAVALIKRFRELTLGVPALIAAYVDERRPRRATPEMPVAPADPAACGAPGV